MVKLMFVFAVVEFLAIPSCINGYRSTFQFEGQFECNKPSFHYSIVVYENDNVFDDAIGHTGRVFSSEPHMYNVSAFDDGDGNNYYEIYFQIVHDCDEDNRVRKHYHDIGEFEVIDG